MSKASLAAFTKSVESLLESGVSFSIVTLLEIRGSAPSVVGARAIITLEGLFFGTVGGGKLEAAAIRRSIGSIEMNRSVPAEIVTWNLQRDIGMTCGGEVKLLFETFCRAEWPIAVFGAGHVAQELIPLLLKLNCNVTCIDDREQWLKCLNDHPNLRKIATTDHASTVENLPVDCYFILMTQGHKTDFPILLRVLSTRSPVYVGVIGSVQKAKVLKRELAEQGIASEKLDSFHCPIGLEIGTNLPVEIAFSVVAQVMAVRTLQLKKLNAT